MAELSSSNQQVEHDLKCWTEFFGAIADGSKPFEIRFNDRGYCVGHRLRLREWDRHAQHYTGREVVKRVTYMTPWMQSENYVVMGLAGETSDDLVHGERAEAIGLLRICWGVCVNENRRELANDLTDLIDRLSL